MSSAGCQIRPIDVNFHLQKSLDIFDKTSADKIWFKKDKEIHVSPLMPSRVKIRIDLWPWALDQTNIQLVNFRHNKVQIYVYT